MPFNKVFFVKLCFSTSFDNYDEDIDEDDEDIPFMTDDQKWKSRKEYKRKFFLLKVKSKEEK